MFDSVLILKGDIRCWSLLGAIGVNGIYYQGQELAFYALYQYHDNKSLSLCNHSPGVRKFQTLI